MQDLTTTLLTAPHLVDNVHTDTDARPVIRTANYHYANMRCAEQAARSISVRRSVGVFPPAELAAAKDVQSSYYLLAAAHRAAAHRVERRTRRALAWSDFKANPFLEIGIMAGDRARSVRRKAFRLARSIRRAVSV